jgi:hypothetical protein
MGTFWHGVVIAKFAFTEISSCNNTSLLEPVPWSCDLTTIAAEGEACSTIAAGSGISNRKECLERTIGSNAQSIVQCLGSSMSPA